MAVRLKTRWHRTRRSRKNIEAAKTEKSIEDLAGVIAFNVWKIAREAFHHMDKEGFSFEDERVIALMNEFAAFGITIADRMVYGAISEEERGRFVSAVAREVARSVQGNSEDLFGEGDYTKPFISLLNDRFAAYSECSFDATEGPGYAFRRLLGDHCAGAMAGTKDAKWVLEQVVEVESFDAIKAMKRLVTDVMGLKRRKAQKPQAAD